MKSSLCKLVLALLICSVCRSHSHAAPPATATTFLNNSAVNVDTTGWLPETPAEGLDFARYVATNWQEVLSTFNTLAPDARRQKLIVVAAEFLPPHGYVSFVNGICNLRTQGKATYDIFPLIASAGMVKSDFLAYNYDQADVKALISKLQTVIQASEPGKWTSYFNGITSGNAKAIIISQNTPSGAGLPESYNAGPSDAYNQLVGH